jgi:DNA-binding CsgD family transcriptional regulator
MCQVASSSISDCQELAGSISSANWPRPDSHSDHLYYRAWRHSNVGPGNEGGSCRAPDQAIPRSGSAGCNSHSARRQREVEIATLRERFEWLTPREREVLPLVVSGLPNKQIAAEIGTSETTVKVHRGQLMRKMGADSLPELVRMAERIGIPTTKP